VSHEPDSLRPSIEDLIGAGAIVAALRGMRTSTEADVAAASFRANENRLLHVLRRCVSGRELVERGFPRDVDLAAAIDSTTAVTCWNTTNAVREFTAFVDS
jgi:2-phosphosulfolactate phosphatase